MHRSLGIYLTAKENAVKPQLGGRLMKAVRSVIASNGATYLQMRSVGSHGTLEMEKANTGFETMKY